MPPLSESDIAPNTVVRHSKQPQLVGVLTGQHMHAAVLMAEVRWGIETKYEAVAILELLDTQEDDSFETLIAKKRYERIEPLRSLMTFEKLSGSLSNVMYSMRTAEIDFYAHQFVPVLKFVNSPLSRLLIADEVGLGKTIEAGLIWTECRARYQARRLLIIAPPTLVPKWIRELNKRFSIEAEYVDAAGLKKRFDHFKSRGPTSSFALVTSYHAIRPRKAEKTLLRPWLRYHDTDIDFEGAENNHAKWGPRPEFYRSLLEWDGANSFIDLAVFDEAHLMKNTATANHFVGDVISTSSQAVLALSATPLTTKTRDLYALLKLVDPDMFHEEAVFNDLSSRNLPAVRLARELQRARVDKSHCLDLLDAIPESIARDNLQSLIAKIPDTKEISEQTKIDLLGKANRLNELGTFLSRTRKVEISGKQAVREPVTLDVHPTNEELTFYNAVLALIRQRVAERGDNLSIFHLIAPSLMMTSCLPVMANKLHTGQSKWGDMEDLATLDSAYTENTEDSNFVGEDQTTIWGGHDILPNYDFEAADTKYLKLRNELLNRAPDEKVIIFAFFKDTLRYLQRRLTSDGFTCLMVTGDIKDPEERDELLLSFQDEDKRILLCSEVIAEGVDLQFCRVLVNYDLPWNPMRVEQRIGRIDRIGQTAESIVIINFHVHGTIDGSIFSQLHSKIGLFKDNIGDLEGIMGDHINKLTRELLTNQLTPEQTAEKIRLASEAIEIERTRVAEIDEESDTLLGLRSYLQNSVNQGQSLGRYIKPSELRIYVDEFFADTYTGQDACILNWDSPSEACVTISFSFKALSDFESYLERLAYPWPKGFNRNNRTVSLTFDPKKHEKLRRKHKKLILANHIHPFVIWITSSYQTQKKSWHPASALKVVSTTVSDGIYIFVVMRVSLKHPALSKEELLFRAVNVDTHETVDLTSSESLLNETIENGSSWSSPTGFPDYSDKLETTVKTLTEDCTLIHQSFAEELELRINAKRSQVENHFKRQIQTQHRRLESMSTSQRARPQDITATQTRIKNLKIRLSEELDVLDSSTEVIPEFKRVACGLIKTNTL